MITPAWVRDRDTHTHTHTHRERERERERERDIYTQLLLQKKDRLYPKSSEYP